MKGKIVFIASHPMSIGSFLVPHISALRSLSNVDVYANISRAVPYLQDMDLDISHVPILRKIHLFFDLIAVANLCFLFKKSRPAVVHTITPKAGLLGMLSAWLCGVPVRIHTFTGQVWATQTGLMRHLLRRLDKCIAWLATDVLVDSSSQREFLIKQGVLNSRQGEVLSFGSICGVNTKRFSPNFEVRNSVRHDMGTAADVLVCLYLGRLNRDKGVLDLAKAFACVGKKHPTAELWVVGPDEADYFHQMLPIMDEVINQVKRVDFTSSPERFMQAADLFCLPSYREGFGSSVIEAAACGVPALTFNNRFNSSIFYFQTRMN